MKPAVVYLTKTGHSRKLAQAVANRLGVAAQRLGGKNAPPPQLPEDCLLFLIGGIYGGHSLPEMLDYARTLAPQQARRVVLMTSSMTGARQEEVRAALEGRGIAVAPDEFTCKGSFLFLGLGHPSRQETEAAAEFAAKAVSQ